MCVSVCVCMCVCACVCKMLRPVQGVEDTGNLGRWRENARSLGNTELLADFVSLPSC